jgi:hypothetical protein
MTCMTSFDDHGGQLATSKTSGIDSKAVVLDLKSSFRIVSINNRSSVFFWELLLVFVPDLGSIRFAMNGLKIGEYYFYPDYTFSFGAR